MSYMKGDLLSKTTSLVKGYAVREPIWLDAMRKSPPAVFPRSDGKIKTISLPEDVYVSKFYQKHPESKHEDPIKLSSFDPVPARLFAHRVLELKDRGVKEEEAMAVADMEYRAERKAKKQAYTRLKQISRVLEKKAPPNPYPSAIKEIQAEERPYVRERFFDAQILDMVKKMKEDHAVEMLERFGPDMRKQERFGPPKRFGRDRPFAWQERVGGQGTLFQGQQRLQDRLVGQDRLPRQPGGIQFVA